MSFHTIHSNILNTTLSETGKWLLAHETYVSWKQQSSGALLWVFGKPGSGKSHLAGQVIEQLRDFCKERNNTEGGAQETFEIEDNVLPHFDNVDPDIVDSTPVEHQGALIHSSGNNTRHLNAEGPATDMNQASIIEMRGDPDINPEIQQCSHRTALAYMYCDSQLVQRLERTRPSYIADPVAGYDTTGLLRSLLQQLYHFLLKDQDIQLLSDLCLETTNEQPTRDEVIKAIRAVIKMFEQTFIVIDGLDECSRIQSLEFEGFCNFLASLADQNGIRSCANVIIFSRPGYTAIDNAVSGYPRIEVDQGMNAEDIGRFIDSRSKTLTKDSLSLKEIRNHLQDNAEGMFLWVSLTIDSIKNERTLKKMKVAARNVPKGLSGAYTDALKRIIRKESSIRDLALKALLWAANSKKPLSESQLLEALVIEPGMSSINDEDKVDGTHLRTDCEDLLHLQDGHYALQHSSLGEFLRTITATDRGDLRIYGELQDQASKIIVEDCFTYFRFSAFEKGPMTSKESLDKMLAQHPFMEYAGMFWGDHLREALAPGDPKLANTACDLLRTQSSRELLHQILMSSDGGWVTRSEKRLNTKEPFPFPSGTTPLHLLSIFGLSTLLSEAKFSLVELDINQPDGFGWYAIDYATQYGHESMCSWIITQQINATTSLDLQFRLRCNEPLWLLNCLIENHWTAIVAKLMDHGFWPVEPYLNRPGQVILHLAACLGHTDMVELLLDSGADPNMYDRLEGTPLIIAAATKNVDVMKLLLSRSANASCQDSNGCTALHYVARSDNPEMIADLINRGASIQRNVWHATPLHDAAGMGHVKVIETLLRFGAQIEATDKFGYTPLMHAVARGKADAVCALLRNGADIATMCHHAQTALHMAAGQGHVEILSILLASERGLAMLDQKDKNMATPLHLAAAKGHTGPAIKLLDNGALVDSEDKYGRTPAMCSLWNGANSLAIMLFDQYGANPNHTGHYGGTIFHMAALSARSVQLASLLSYGVDHEVKDRQGRSALQFAIDLNNLPFVDTYTKHVSAETVFGKGRELSGQCFILPS